MNSGFASPRRGRSRKCRPRKAQTRKVEQHYFATGALSNPSKAEGRINPSESLQSVENAGPSYPRAAGCRNRVPPAKRIDPRRLLPQSRCSPAPRWGILGTWGSDPCRASSLLGLSRPCRFFKPAAAAAAKPRRARSPRLAVRKAAACRRESSPARRPVRPTSRRLASPLPTDDDHSEPGGCASRLLASPLQSPPRAPLAAPRLENRDFFPSFGCTSLPVAHTSIVNDAGATLTPDGLEFSDAGVRPGRKDMRRVTPGTHTPTRNRGTHHALASNLPFARPRGRSRLLGLLLPPSLRLASPPLLCSGLRHHLLPPR